MARILVVDDEPVVLSGLCGILQLAGHHAVSALTSDDALVAAREASLDAAVVDVKLDHRDGLATLAALREIHPGLPCVVITGHPSYPVPVDVVARAGPYSYLRKPFSSKQLEQALARELRDAPANEPSAAAYQHPRPVTEKTEILPPFEGIVGNCSAMHRVFDQIRKFAPTHEPVLILGESGTGKELVAAALHRLSGRTGPFVPVNCCGRP
jgi:DNA-binding NtrC family response regulator